MTNHNGINFIAEQVSRFLTTLILLCLRCNIMSFLLIYWRLICSSGQPSPTNECCSRRERAFRLRLHFKAEIEITRQFNRLLPRRKVGNFSYCNATDHKFLVFRFCNVSIGQEWHLKEMVWFLILYLLRPRLITLYSDEHGSILQERWSWPTSPLATKRCSTFNHVAGLGKTSFFITLLLT